MMELLTTGRELDDDALLDLYAYPPAGTTPDGVTLRANFVSSIDGSVTIDGRSGPLGGPADMRVFRLLRRLADVILVGAGTLRAEHYDGMRMHPRAVDWRRAQGMPDHPVLAAVSLRLELDPAAALFTEAPVRPLVLTAETSDEGRRAELAEVADVVVCGRERVEPALLRAELARRGLRRVLCEGGPRLFGSLVAADAVDELCLTLDPVLEGGLGPRVASSSIRAQPQRLHPAHLLLDGEVLLGRFVRTRGSA